jgi:hypothetical protein
MLGCSEKYSKERRQQQQRYCPARMADLHLPETHTAKENSKLGHSYDNQPANALYTVASRFIHSDIK